MREFTKAFTSFSWAVTLFGLQQVVGAAARGRDGRGGPSAADALDAATRSLEGQLGEGIGQVFRAGDRLQRSMVDLAFGLLGVFPGTGMARMPGTMTGTPGPGMPGGTGSARAGGCGTCPGQGGPTGGATGWGPVPPPNVV